MKKPLQKANKRTAIIASVVFAAMVGASFAAAPLYSMFCKVTGYGGTTQRAEAAPKTILSQSVQVRFDTNVAPGSPITFVSEANTKTVRLGETGLMFFKVTNPTDRTVTAVATYNVTPVQTGKYFKKLECFCFEKRSFKPRETIDLPVVFFVDPDMAKDRDAMHVDQITLSYTYFDGGAPEVKTVSAEAPKGLGRVEGGVVGRVVASP
jgi:cytochrome c oxidase assembly protein subunit 11